MFIKRSDPSAAVSPSRETGPAAVTITLGDWRPQRVGHLNAPLRPALNVVGFAVWGQAFAETKSAGRNRKITRRMHPV